MPTWRLYALLLVAAPLGAVGGPLDLLALAVIVLALAAAGVDWFLAADGRRIDVRRVLDSDKLSLGAWNPVRIELRNASGRSQRLQLRDVVPIEFSMDVPAPLFHARLGPGETTVLRYHVRPPYRGEDVFDDLHLRVREGAPYERGHVVSRNHRRRRFARGALAP